MQVLEKLWTYERILEEFPAESRIELIHNEIFMPPVPSTEHQIVSKYTFRKLDNFVESQKLGQVFYAPFDVILDSQTVVQPDIVFISNSNLQVLTQRGCEGVPDLVIEIISPSTFYRDSVEKFQLYERFGVKEYWLVEPANEVIEVFHLENGKYVLHSLVNADEGEEVQSYLLNGLEVKKSEIFPKKK